MMIVDHGVSHRIISMRENDNKITVRFKCCRSSSPGSEGSCEDDDRGPWCVAQNHIRESSLSVTEDGFSCEGAHNFCVEGSWEPFKHHKLKNDNDDNNDT